MPKVKVSIIIVHYQSKEKLFACLESIKDAKAKVSCETIVVDNDEVKTIGPNLKRSFPWVKYIKSSGNIGYGAGNNLGARYAKGEYLFILNPDTSVTSGAIDKLTGFLDRNKKAGIVAPNLVDKTGKVYSQIGSRILTPLRGIVVLSFLNKIFPGNPVSSSYWMRDDGFKKVCQVDVIPGSAFLVRECVFRQLGGFDENFFLYFEESDFCKRVGEAGWEIYLLSELQITHLWGGSTPKTKKINEIFAQSRFYYFKKHYGVLNACLVEAFARFSKESALLIAILAVSAFLRLWMLDRQMQFIGDFGWYYLSARDFLLTGKLPLLGIASSVPVLRQGSIFTWMLAGALLLGNFNPVYGGYLSSFLGILAVWGTYVLSREWFGERVALIATALAATSPFIVAHDRIPYITAGIFPLTLLIAWLAKRGIKEIKVAPFLLGFFISILYQFELAGFILLPIIVVTYIWQKAKPKLETLFRFVLGGLTGLVPFIISDIREGTYLQTIGFGFWFIRKVFRGILSFSKGVNLQIFSNGLAYFRDIIFSQSSAIALTIFALAVVYFVYSCNQAKKLDFAKNLIIVWLILAVVGFLLKGVFSEAYMPIIFFPMLAVLAYFFNFAITKFCYLGWTLLFIIIGVNTAFLIKSGFASEEAYSVSKMNEVVKFIVRDVEGVDYQLVYRGPADMYESGDNAWRYLLWLQGNEPERRASLIYTVSYEGLGNVSSFDKTIQFGSISVGMRQK